LDLPTQPKILDYEDSTTTPVHLNFVDANL